jgi:hypothetical protein
MALQRTCQRDGVAVRASQDGAAALGALPAAKDVAHDVLPAGVCRRQATVQDIHAGPGNPCTGLLSGCRPAGCTSHWSSGIVEVGQ